MLLSVSAQVPFVVLCFHFEELSKYKQTSPFMNAVNSNINMTAELPALTSPREIPLDCRIRTAPYRLHQLKLPSPSSPPFTQASTHSLARSPSRSFITLSPTYILADHINPDTIVTKKERLAENARKSAKIARHRLVLAEDIAARFQRDVKQLRRNRAAPYKIDRATALALEDADALAYARRHIDEENERAAHLTRKAEDAARSHAAYGSARAAAAQEQSPPAETSHERSQVQSPLAKQRIPIGRRLKDSPVRALHGISGNRTLANLQGPKAATFPYVLEDKGNPSVSASSAQRAETGHDLASEDIDDLEYDDSEALGTLANLQLFAATKATTQRRQVISDS
ncbi:MAG: hypothetical protein Q9164_003322, partial [Protoblastenia rupestris]